MVIMKVLCCLLILSASIVSGNQQTLDYITSPCLSYFYYIPVRIPVPEADYKPKQWCVADDQVTDDILQKALDWACGPGHADCTTIQPNTPCYLPNTVKHHASFAFNSYWQKFKKQGATCEFHAAAMVTDTDPSHGSCKFEVTP